MASGAQWQKSSYSQEQGDCIECAVTEETIAVREGDAPGRVMEVRAHPLGIFLAGVKAGAFDGLAG